MGAECWPSKGICTWLAISPWERGRPARILVKALLQRQSAGEPTNPVKPIATTLPVLCGRDARAPRDNNSSRQ